MTTLNDTSPWKSISESGSLQKIRDEVVFFMIFFLTQRNKGQVFIV